jgi:hypothetical protein
MLVFSVMYCTRYLIFCASKTNLEFIIPFSELEPTTPNRVAGRGSSNDLIMGKVQ